jgi:hypothetical protein
MHHSFRTSELHGIDKYEQFGLHANDSIELDWQDY